VIRVVALLDQAQFNALCTFADRVRSDPRSEAAALIVAGLQRAGFELDADPASDANVPDSETVHRHAGHVTVPAACERAAGKGAL
jgi:hypothetical protein